MESYIFFQLGSCKFVAIAPYTNCNSNCIGRLLILSLAKNAFGKFTHSVGRCCLYRQMLEIQKMLCFTSGGSSQRYIKDGETVPVSTVSHSHKHNAEVNSFSSLDRKYNLKFDYYSILASNKMKIIHISFPLLNIIFKYQRKIIFN